MEMSTDTPTFTSTVEMPKFHQVTSSAEEMSSIAFAVEQCWDDAVQIYKNKSGDNQQKLEHCCLAADSMCTLQELLQAVENAKKASRAQESTQSPWVKKVTGGLDRFQQHYAPAVDVLIQQQPNITPIVWGSFRFLLRIGSRQSGLADEIEDGMILISMNIETWHETIKNTHQDSKVLEICSQLFSHVVSFLIEARLYAESSGPVVRFLKSGFTSTPDIIENAVQYMRYFSELLLQSAMTAAESKNAIFRSIGVRFFGQQLTENGEQMNYRNKSDKQYHAIVESIEYSVRQSKLRQEEEHRRRKINRALQMLSHEHKSVQNIPDRAKNTCTWIESHESYMQWVGTNYDKPLWIHGCPGCGKSVMAKYLKERLACLGEPLFAHYFSLNTEKRSADTLSFARAIIVQVLKKGLETTLPGLQKAADQLATYLHQLDNSSQLKFAVVQPVIRGALTSIERYTLIVDGLDECEEFGQPIMDLIDSLMVGPPACPPKIVIFSRRSDTLTRICANTIAIALDEAAIMPDIQRFVADQAGQHPILKKIETKIIEKTNSSCHGNFLWASTMITSLLGQAKHQDARLKRLERIPADLIMFYEQLVHETARGKEDWELKLRREIFLLLLNPKRALTVEEVTLALQFRGSRRQPDKKRLEDVSKTIERLCWPLVTIRENHVLLMHTLVEDYLTRPVHDKVNGDVSVHMTRAESNATLASRCLHVLSEDQNRDPQRISYWFYKNLYYEFEPSASLARLLKYKDEDLVLYEYAARYWTDHLTAVKEPSTALLDMASSFLHNYEFVMYSEYLYDYNSAEIGPISNVLATLRSWLASLSPCMDEHLSLDDFFEDPYRKLAKAYDRSDGSKILKYLCLYQLGNFYGLQAKLKPRYETLREVSGGLEAILGGEEPLVLRAKYMFAACLLPRGEFSRALNLARTVGKVQKIKCGLETNDYWATLQLVAVLQFLMTDFDAATTTQAEVSKGLSGIPSARRFNLQMSDTFTGYIYEARGLMDDALLKYTLVEQTQREALGEHNATTLSSQVSMASIYRKQGHFFRARERLVHALAGRQVLFGEMHSTVVDTTIQFIVLDRETGDESSQATALARIDLLKGNGSLEYSFERYCQVRHLEALILVDQGELKKPLEILQSLLDEQNQKGRDANNRSLLWVRLSLATILRGSGKEEEAPVLFENLVMTTIDDDLGPHFDCLDTPKELEFAELALRLVRKRMQKEAEQLLKENNLRWVRKEDFWLIQGFPSVDTAWMKDP